MPTAKRENRIRERVLGARKGEQERKREKKSKDLSLSFSWQQDSKHLQEEEEGGGKAFFLLFSLFCPSVAA